MTWMRTFTTRRACFPEADTEAGALGLVVTSMMSNDTHGDLNLSPGNETGLQKNGNGVRSILYLELRPE